MENTPTAAQLTKAIGNLEKAINKGDANACRKTLSELVEGFPAP